MTQPVDERTAPPEPAPRASRFPTAFTVLFGVLVVMWGLGFVIPAGKYTVTEDGFPVPGSYQPTEAHLGVGERLMDLFMAPVNGLYGVRPQSGPVSASASGEVYGAAEVFLFVLVIGMFVTMCTKSGALDAGIQALARRLGDRGPLLVGSMMVLFSVLGSIEGFGEETLGLYVLFVPLVLRLGYDRMVAAATLMLGAGVGVMASTINPFATGVASSIAGVSLTDGMLLRLIMWVLFTAIAVWYVVRYASRVKADPTRSLVPRQPEDAELATRLEEVEGDRLLGRHRAILGLMVFTFAFMVFSLIPWAQLVGGYDAPSYPWQLDWGFAQITALFLVMSVVVGLIARMGEKGMVDGLMQGGADFIAPALIIAFARSVTVVMYNAGITDTILHALENLMASMPGGVYAVVLYAVNLPLSFLVPSTSGLATLTMPIFGPLTSLQGLHPSLAVTAFQTASGWINLFTPTSAIIMGGLVMSKVGYDTWLRFLAPLLGLYLVLGAGLLAAAAMF